MVLDGDPPRSPDQIVLASATMRRLHVRIGDTVNVVSGGQREHFRITGRLFELSAGAVFSGRFDEGGGVTLQGLRRVEPKAIVTLFLVDYKQGTNPKIASSRLQHDFGPTVMQRVPARDVANLVRVDTLPWLLATLLAVLGAAALIQVLSGAVHRRKHELAILEALGCERRQLAAAVLWQTWVLALPGITLGAALGTVIGRTTWTAVADNIGSVQPVVAPATTITMLCALSALAATVIALVPAFLATRANPAFTLRSE
jgi:ABC-type lipoprotein release transport system permease subunit